MSTVDDTQTLLHTLQGEPSSNWEIFKEGVYRNRWKIAVGVCVGSALIALIILLTALSKDALFKNKLNGKGDVIDTSLTSSGKMVIGSTVVLGGSATVLIGLAAGAILSRRPDPESERRSFIDNHKNKIKAAIIATVLALAILGAVLLANGIKSHDYLTEEISQGSIKLTNAGVKVFVGSGTLGTAVLMPLAIWLGWRQSIKNDEKDARDVTTLTDEFNEGVAIPMPEEL